MPSKADGWHSAEQIYEEQYDECKERVENEKEGVYSSKCNESLIDSWMMLDHHKYMFVDYVQKAFDSWEE
nr:MAG TPA: ubiquinol-cytochrome C reductase [Caudoviricetes sp.]